MALLAQFVKQYDASSRAQFVAQYVDPATEMFAVSNNFDAAIATTTITNELTSTPDVAIDPYDPGDVSGWMMVYLNYTGCVGKTPQFTLDATDYRGGIQVPAPPYEPVWRVKNNTNPGTIRPRGWSPFDNFTGDPIMVFSNSTPFADDEIEVAFKPRWRYIDTQRAFDFVENSGMAVELPSSIAAAGLPRHVHAQFTHVGARANNAPIIPINMYACGVDDTSVSPAGSFDKLNFIFSPGMHSSEDQGNDACWEAVFFYLEGVGAVADWFRQHCRLFIYDVNPSGRYYGKERHTEEATDEDPNRSFDDTNSVQVNSVIAAIALDLTRTDVLWDFHGAFWLNGNPDTEEYGIYETYATEVLWRARVNTIISPLVVGDLGTVPAGAFQWYGNGTLGAQLSSTPEFPIAPPGYPDPLASYGPVVEAYVEAVMDMVTADELTLTSTAITASVAITEPQFDTVSISAENTVSASFATQEPQFDTVSITLDSNELEFSATVNIIEQQFDSAAVNAEAVIAASFMAQEPQFDSANILIYTNSVPVSLVKTRITGKTQSSRITGTVPVRAISGKEQRTLTKGVTQKTTIIAGVPT